MGIWDWDWVGVLDAEDLLHPDLLTMVDHRFRHDRRRASCRPACS